MKAIGAFLGGVFGGLVVIIAALIKVSFVALIYVIVGLFIGWVVALIFGTIVTDGINALIGSSITPQTLPFVIAAVALIAAFFRTPVRGKEDAE